MSGQEEKEGFLDGTFLSELSGISSFIEPSFGLGVGDLAIGHMNTFEKAIHTWLLSSSPILESIEEDAKRIFDKYNGKGECMLEDSDLAALEAEALLREKVEAAQKLLRLSVQERLKIPAYVRIKLARGFIVAIRAEDVTRKPTFRAITTTISFCGEARPEDSDIPPPHMRH